MSSTWGNNIKISVFGESHGSAIGVVMDNIPSGIALDWNEIRHHMQRRAPGRNPWSTPRKEDDQFDVLSGYYNGYTTGTPLSMVIYGKDKRSQDYNDLANLPRPGHADYTGRIRYNGFEDPRGGGHFSGRLTAPLVLAGSIARQILAQKGVVIGAHIQSIANVADKPFDMVNVDDIMLLDLANKEFAVIDNEISETMIDTIFDAMEDEDSVGGIIEAAAISLPAGIGSPMFDGVESKVSSLLFSIPAVKGVEFGIGFEISTMRGSIANDEYIINHKGFLTTETNHNGGLLGGITNSMPVIARVAIKPTPSIGKEQNTVNVKTGMPQKIKVEGRHDPCIVPRAVPVVESALALALLDCYMDRSNRRL